MSRKQTVSRKRSDDAEVQALKAKLRRDLARVEKMADEAKAYFHKAAALQAEWHRRIEQLDRAGLIHDITDPRTALVTVN